MPSDASSHRTHLPFVAKCFNFAVLKSPFDSFFNEVASNVLRSFAGLREFLFFGLKNPRVIDFSNAKFLDRRLNMTDCAKHGWNMPEILAS